MRCDLHGRGPSVVTRSGRAPPMSPRSRSVRRRVQCGSLRLLRGLLRRRSARSRRTAATATCTRHSSSATTALTTRTTLTKDARRTAPGAPIAAMGNPGGQRRDVRRRPRQHRLLGDRCRVRIRLPARALLRRWHPQRFRTVRRRCRREHRRVRWVQRGLHASLHTAGMASPSATRVKSAMTVPSVASRARPRVRLGTSTEPSGVIACTRARFGRAELGRCLSLTVPRPFRPPRRGMDPRDFVASPAFSRGRGDLVCHQGEQPPPNATGPVGGPNLA